MKCDRVTTIEKAKAVSLILALGALSQAALEKIELAIKLALDLR